MPSADFLSRSDYLSIAGIVLSLVGIALSIIGLKLARNSIRDGAALTSKTDQVVKQAEAIGRSLSTIYLGPFPDYMPAVIDLIQEASAPLVIVTIAPAFGCFSNPRAWEKLSAALMEAQSRGVSIKLITGNGSRRRDNYRIQFSDALRNWSEWLNTGETANLPTYSVRLKKFVDRYSLTELPTDGHAFLRELEIVQKESLRQTYYRAEILEKDDLVPFVAWIEGDQKAVFAFSHPSGTPPAFSSRDKNVIDALLGLAERLCEAGI